MQIEPYHCRINKYCYSEDEYQGSQLLHYRDLSTSEQCYIIILYTLFEQLGMTAASLFAFLTGHYWQYISQLHSRPQLLKKWIVLTTEKITVYIQCYNNVTHIGFYNTYIHWTVIYLVKSTSYPTFETPPGHFITEMFKQCLQ